MRPKTPATMILDAVECIFWSAGFYVGERQELNFYALAPSCWGADVSANVSYWRGGLVVNIYNDKSKQRLAIDVELADPNCFDKLFAKLYEFTVTPDSATACTPT